MWKQALRVIPAPAPRRMPPRCLSAAQRAVFRPWAPLAVRPWRSGYHRPCMPSRPPSKTPSLTIAEALRGAPPLARLVAALAESRARLDVIRPLLPPGLRATVQAGPIDENGWRLLVAHNAAAAKLRQLRPALMSALRVAQLPVAHISIRVQQPGAAAPDRRR